MWAVSRALTCNNWIGMACEHSTQKEKLSCACKNLPIRDRDFIEWSATAATVTHLSDNCQATFTSQSHIRPSVNVIRLPGVWNLKHGENCFRKTSQFSYGAISHSTQPEKYINWSFLTNNNLLSINLTVKVHFWPRSLYLDANHRQRPIKILTYKRSGFVEFENHR